MKIATHATWLAAALFKINFLMAAPELIIQEIDRYAEENRTITVVYDVEAQGLNPKEEYALNLEDAAHKCRSLYGFRTGAQGQFTIYGEKPNHFTIKIGPLFQGETCTFKLGSKDPKFLLVRHITPHPIQARGQNIALVVSPVSDNGRTFHLQGNGFPPNKKITCHLRYPGTRKKIKVCTNPCGCFETMITVSPNQHGTGIASVQVKNDRETLEVKFDIGKYAELFALDKDNKLRKKSHA